LLQCPDEQVVCVDIARHNTGEPGRGGVDDYGYTSAKIVLLPLMKEDGVAGSADGVLREPQAPHALVADLLGLLASQVSDLRGGVEEDTRTINFFLPTCKCSVVSAQVLSAAYSGDTVIQVRVPGEGCDAADESGLKEKIELIGRRMPAQRVAESLEMEVPAVEALAQLEARPLRQQAARISRPCISGLQAYMLHIIVHDAYWACEPI
jgi:hypothetical protein